MQATCYDCYMTNSTRITERPALDEWLDMADELLERLEPALPVRRPRPKTSVK